VTTTEPTIVLVHGAFADASRPNGVLELLRVNGRHCVGRVE
jgi:hypothetical protein